ncbi:MAG TPA: hypothetical protein VIL74_14395 [Pyrinomonadaceae bacterium]|jgi:hypothetical protein
MAGKDYGLYAVVGIYDKDPDIPTPTSHYTLEIERFGIRKGQELSSDEMYTKGIGTMGAIFKAMKRPSPMSIVWAPSSGQKMLFTDLKKRKLQIEISFVRSGNRTTNPNVVDLMTMDNVRVRSVAPELVKANGSGMQKMERIDAVFTKFEF